MTTGYVIRCAGCDQDAPLTGDLLAIQSQQVAAFQQRHQQARCHVSVECPPAVVVMTDQPKATIVAA